jgi:hypothetical protein
VQGKTGNQRVSTPRPDLRAQPNRFAGRAAGTITLRPEVLACLEARAKAKGLPLAELVNDLLEKDIELIEVVE